MNWLSYLRQFRLFNYAIFDFLVSFLGIYLLSPLLTKLMLKLSWHIPRLTWLYWTIPLSILIHFLFGQMTPLTQDFLDPYNHYLLKFITFLLIWLGYHQLG